MIKRLGTFPVPLCFTHNQLFYNGSKTSVFPTNFIYSYVKIQNIVYCLSFDGDDKEKNINGNCNIMIANT